MKVLVFGASGRTGHQIVAQALARKLVVTTFVRKPEKLAVHDSALYVVQGDVADYDGVAAAVMGQDAVISVLGVSTLQVEPLMERQTAPKWKFSLYPTRPVSVPPLNATP